MYADQPYLYGPANSSVNTLHIGPKGGKTEGNGSAKGDDYPGLVFEEGGDEDGLKHRKERGIPDSELARKKHFLNEENRKAWEWEAGREYGCDFFNPYLDFNGTSPFRTRRSRGFGLIMNRFCTETPRFHAPDHEILGRSRSAVRFPLLLNLPLTICYFCNFAYQPLFTTGKSESAHIRSDTCSKTARPTKFYSSSSLPCT